MENKHKIAWGIITKKHKAAFRELKKAQMVFREVYRLETSTSDTLESARVTLEIAEANHEAIRQYADTYWKTYIEPTL